MTSDSAYGDLIRVSPLAKTPSETLHSTHLVQAGQKKGLTRGRFVIFGLVTRVCCLRERLMRVAHIAQCRQLHHRVRTWILINAKPWNKCGNYADVHRHLTNF